MKKTRLLPEILSLSLLCFGGVAHGAILVTTAALSGAVEAPPNASPGTGFTTVTYNSTAQTLRVEVSYSGLLAGVTAAHIHGPTATPHSGTAGVATPVPTFPGFPSGTSGAYDVTFDLTEASSWNPAFVANNGGTLAGAESALAAALLAETTYLNIHTSDFPGGEIRGFLVPIPEPASCALVAGLGLGGFGLCRRLRRLRR